MADRVLFISWGAPVAGREERGLEVFNESMGFYGRLQQEGKIEGFDVCILDPNGGLNGYIQLHASNQQLAALRDNEEFLRLTIDASLIVQNLSLAEGSTNERVAQDIAMYQESVSKVPQSA
jgi:hypothetical protein